MTQYEALRFAESALRMLTDGGVDAKDVKYLDMYDDFVRLSGEGHKRTYIMYYLAERYGCDRATIYRVVARMQRNLP